MSIFNLRNIRDRIMLSFLVLVLTIIFLAGYAFYSLKQSEKIREVSNGISRLERTTLLLLKADMDFLYFETINLDFYKNGEGKILTYRDSLINLIENDFQVVSDNITITDFKLQEDLSNVYKNLTAYDSTFHDLLTNIKIRGFKDFGLEGKMRDYAHALEERSDRQMVAMKDVLSLRRHEKDYFMRNELVYVEKLNRLSSKIMSSLVNFGNDTVAYSLLSDYTSTFNQVVEIEKHIGLTPNDGLMGRLKNQKDTITDKFVYLSMMADGTADNLVSKSSSTFIIIAIFSSLLSIMLSYALATMISRPVLRLSEIMGQFSVHKSFQMTDELKSIERTEEIKNLFHAFSDLARQVHTQFEEIEEKSVLLERQNKKLIETNTQLDRFLYSTAHDFRSPLTSVLGLINVSRHENDQDKWKSYMNMMEDSITKLDDFINDIVDYAKNKNLELQRNHINLNSQVNNILNKFQHLPNFEKINFGVEVEGDVPFVQDQHRLEIVLGNLIENAIKYHDHGKKEQFIRVEASVSKSNTIVSIQDNGRGIEEKYHEKIFDMFYRANEYSKGSGLGLFLVSESLKMIGGEIRVESVHREGTTFILEIPNMAVGEPEEVKA